MKPSAGLQAMNYRREKLEGRLERIIAPTHLSQYYLTMKQWKQSKLSTRREGLRELWSIYVTKVIVIRSY